VIYSALAASVADRRAYGDCFSSSLIASGLARWLGDVAGHWAVGAEVGSGAEDGFGD
jgi:hypothetical protein